MTPYSWLPIRAGPLPRHQGGGGSPRPAPPYPQGEEKRREEKRSFQGQYAGSRRVQCDGRSVERQRR
jgi:hypothetical protein